MNSILNYIDKKEYNIFQSIQLLYDMDMYKDMNGIFKELKDILPEKIHISTEGISDEKTLFFLNEINGCSLETSYYYWVDFIKDDKSLFRWNLQNEDVWIDYYNIWVVFGTKYYMTYEEIQDFTKNILEIHCKIMGVTPKSP